MNDAQTEAKHPPVFHYGIRQVGVCGQRNAWRKRTRTIVLNTIDGRPSPTKLYARTHEATSELAKVTCPTCRESAAYTTMERAHRYLDESCPEWRPEYLSPFGAKQRKVYP